MSSIGFEAGEIARLTLKRGDAHNALTRGMMSEMKYYLADVAKSDSRALILDAEGKTFCAGVDFQELLTGDWTTNPLTALCEQLATLPMPSIAALQGPFIGGGAELALSCDFRIAVPTTRCQVPAAKIGVHYEPQGIARVVAVGGLQFAKRLFLTTQSFDAEALLAFHVVDEIVEPDRLDAKVMETAEKIAALAPLSVRGMKTSLETLDGTDDFDARARIADAFASDDFQEALLALREKRTPTFHGR